MEKKRRELRNLNHEYISSSQNLANTLSIIRAIFIIMIIIFFIYSIYNISEADQAMSQASQYSKEIADTLKQTKTTYIISFIFEAVFLSCLIALTSCCINQIALSDHLQNQIICLNDIKAEKIKNTEKNTNTTTTYTNDEDDEDDEDDE